MTRCHGIERGLAKPTGAATGKRERKAREERADRAPGSHGGGPPAVVGIDVRPASVKEQ